MAQTRKKKVLQQVESQRRQRTIITVVIVAVLITIIVLALVFLRPAVNPVQLPDYLSRCVVGTLVIHSHPHLVLTISGRGQTLPVTFNAGCAQPMHTHDSSGIIHVESDQFVSFTIGDWFSLWGYWAASPAVATFNSTLVLGHATGGGHTLLMTVNGSVDNNATDFKDGNPSNFQNLLIPKSAGESSNDCLLAPNCSPFNIVITYT